MYSVEYCTVIVYSTVQFTVVEEEFDGRNCGTVVLRCPIQYTSNELTCFVRALVKFWHKKDPVTVN